MTKRKFKVGDKVKVVKTGYGVSIVDSGKETTILEVGAHQTLPRYKVSTEGFAYGSYEGKITWADEQSFELVETAPQPPKPLIIEYGGIRIEFDASNKKVGILVNGILNGIYEHAQADD